MVLIGSKLVHQRYTGHRSPKMEIENSLFWLPSLPAPIMTSIPVHRDLIQLLLNYCEPTVSMWLWTIRDNGETNQGTRKVVDKERKARWPKKSDRLSAMSQRSPVPHINNPSTRMATPMDDLSPSNRLWPSGKPQKETLLSGDDLSPNGGTLPRPVTVTSIIDLSEGGVKNAADRSLSNDSHHSRLSSPHQT